MKRESLSAKLGSIAAVAGADGSAVQRVWYFASGLPVTENAATAAVNSRLHIGKEFTAFDGLWWYDNDARQYDPLTMRFTTLDPLSANYPSLSPYAYCANNPVNYIDPTGEYTEVKEIGDGLYRVAGGVLNDDTNIYIAGTNQTVSIGETATPYSFYDSDEEKWETGSIINTFDDSGNEFLSDIQTNTPPLIEYMQNAGKGGKYDFKVAEGPGKEYRGMPITLDGKEVIASARDVGNIAAGYVAGKYSIGYSSMHAAFDAYHMWSNRILQREGISSTSAQDVGFRIGYAQSEAFKLYVKLRTQWEDFKQWIKELW